MGDLTAAFAVVRTATGLMRFGWGVLSQTRSGVHVSYDMTRSTQMRVRVSYRGPGCQMGVKGFVVAPAWQLREEGTDAPRIAGPGFPKRIAQNTQETWVFDAPQIAYEYFLNFHGFGKGPIPRGKRKFMLKVQLETGRCVTVGTFEASKLYSLWPEYQKKAGAELRAIGKNNGQ